MFHPFINVGEISSKSMEELQSKIAELRKKLNFAYNTGNGPMINQLNMIINSYQTIINKKLDDTLTTKKYGTKISVENDKK